MIRCCSKDKLLNTEDSPAADKEVYHVCPSKLSKRELEDLYFKMMRNNMDLKQKVNQLEEKVKCQTTRLQRMLATQKAYMHAEPRECCVGTKTIVQEQKNVIEDLKNENENLNHQLGQLNMKLCSTKQFLNRGSREPLTKRPFLDKKKNNNMLYFYPDPPFKRGKFSDAANSASSAKCHYPRQSPRPWYIKRSDEPSPGTRSNPSQKIDRIATSSPRNNQKSNKPDSNIEAIMSTKSPVASNTPRNNQKLKIEPKTEPMSNKRPPDKLCDRDECKAEMKKLQQKILDLQKELSKAQDEYSRRITRLEQDVLNLHSENNSLKTDKAVLEHNNHKRDSEASELRTKLSETEAFSRQLSSELNIEKGKVAELEAQVNAANLINEALKAFEERLYKDKNNTRKDSPTASLQIAVSDFDSKLTNEQESPEARVSSKADKKSPDPENKQESPKARVSSNADKISPDSVNRQESPKARVSSNADKKSPDLENKQESPRVRVSSKADKKSSDIDDKQESPKAGVSSNADKISPDFENKQGSLNARVSSNTDKKSLDSQNKQESPKARVSSNADKKSSDSENKQESPKARVSSNADKKSPDFENKQESPKARVSSNADIKSPDFEDNQENPKARVSSNADINSLDIEDKQKSKINEPKNENNGFTKNYPDDEHKNVHYKEKLSISNERPEVILKTLQNNLANFLMNPNPNISPKGSNEQQLQAIINNIDNNKKLNQSKVTSRRPSNSNRDISEIKDASDEKKSLDEKNNQDQTLNGRKDENSEGNKIVNNDTPFIRRRSSTGSGNISNRYGTALSPDINPFQTKKDNTPRRQSTIDLTLKKSIAPNLNNKNIAQSLQNKKENSQEENTDAENNNKQIKNIIDVEKVANKGVNLKQRRESYASSKNNTAHTAQSPNENNKNNQEENSYVANYYKLKRKIADEKKVPPDDSFTRNPIEFQTNTDNDLNQRSSTRRESVAPNKNSTPQSPGNYNKYTKKENNPAENYNTQSGNILDLEENGLNHYFTTIPNKFKTNKDDDLYSTRRESIASNKQNTAQSPENKKENLRQEKIEFQTNRVNDLHQGSSTNSFTFNKNNALPSSKNKNENSQENNMITENNKQNRKIIDIDKFGLDGPFKLIPNKAQTNNDDDLYQRSPTRIESIAHNNNKHDTDQSPDKNNQNFQKDFRNIVDIEKNSLNEPFIPILYKLQINADDDLHQQSSTRKESILSNKNNTSQSTDTNNKNTQKENTYAIKINKQSEKNIDLDQVGLNNSSTLIPNKFQINKDGEFNQRSSTRRGTIPPNIKNTNQSLDKNNKNVQKKNTHTEKYNNGGETFDAEKFDFNKHLTLIPNEFQTNKTNNDIVKEEHTGILSSIDSLTILRSPSKKSNLNKELQKSVLVEYIDECPRPNESGRASLASENYLKTPPLAEIDGNKSPSANSSDSELVRADTTNPRTKGTSTAETPNKSTDNTDNYRSNRTPVPFANKTTDDTITSKAAETSTTTSTDASTAKTTDDSGFKESEKNATTDLEKGLEKVNENLMKKVIELQKQLDELLIHAKGGYPNQQHTNISATSGPHEDSCELTCDKEGFTCTSECRSRKQAGYSNENKTNGRKKYDNMRYQIPGPMPVDSLRNNMYTKKERVHQNQPDAKNIQNTNFHACCGTKEENAQFANQETPPGNPSSTARNSTAISNVLSVKGSQQVLNSQPADLPQTLDNKNVEKTLALKPKQFANGTAKTSETVQFSSNEAPTNSKNPMDVPIRYSITTNRWLTNDSQSVSLKPKVSDSVVAKVKDAEIHSIFSKTLKNATVKCSCGHSQGVIYSKDVSDLHIPEAPRESNINQSIIDLGNPQNSTVENVRDKQNRDMLNIKEQINVQDTTNNKPTNINTYYQPRRESQKSLETINQALTPDFHTKNETVLSPIINPYELSKNSLPKKTSDDKNLQNNSDSSITKRRPSYRSENRPDEKKRISFQHSADRLAVVTDQDKTWPDDATTISMNDKVPKSSPDEKQPQDKRKFTSFVTSTPKRPEEEFQIDKTNDNQPGAQCDADDCSKNTDPKTYTVSTPKKRGSIPEDTDQEISSMTDLPSEKETAVKSRQDPRNRKVNLNLGEDKTTTTNSTSGTTPGESVGSSAKPFSLPSSLSEGEMPRYSTRASLRRSDSVYIDPEPPDDKNVVRVDKNVILEKSLVTISQELARCRQLLEKSPENNPLPLNDTKIEEKKRDIMWKEKRPSKIFLKDLLEDHDVENKMKQIKEEAQKKQDNTYANPTISDKSTDTAIELRRVEGTPRITDGPDIPHVMFILHIGTIVLSDEAVINSRNMSLVLTWKFYNQNVALSHMVPGRVVHFDFSTEYDLKFTEEFLQYLKNEELLINLCEVNKLDDPLATCSLPLREPLLHTNRRADMSLALVAGPRMQRYLSTSDPLDTRDEMGVLDLWCMLRAEQHITPHIQKVISTARASIIANKINSQPGSQTYTFNPFIMHLDDEQDEGRLSSECDTYYKHDCSRNRPLTGNNITSNNYLSNYGYTDPNNVPNKTDDGSLRGNSRMSVSGVSRDHQSYWTTNTGGSSNLSLFVQKKNTEFHNTEASNYKKSSTDMKQALIQAGQPYEGVMPESIDVVIQWLALNEKCRIMTDPNIQMIYIAYNFLGRGGAELETPMAMPKPTLYQDKCQFNFKKSFLINTEEKKILSQLARNRSPRQGRPTQSTNPTDCVMFTIVSEPVEDPLGLNNCEDVGVAYLFFGDLLVFSAGSDSYTDVIPIFDARSTDDTVCGLLGIRVDGLDVVRKCVSPGPIASAFNRNQIF